jgi:hypothetical protein
MIQSLFIYRSLLAGIKKESFDLRSKHDATMVDAVAQWLDADTISDKPEFMIPLVPQGDREHPPKLMDTIYSPLLERMQDDFRIRMVGLPVMVTDTVQFCTNGGVVINLSIENDPQGTVLVAHGLCRAI